eukprot:gene13365-28324_t
MPRTPSPIQFEKDNGSNPSLISRPSSQSNTTSRESTPVTPLRRSSSSQRFSATNSKRSSPSTSFRKQLSSRAGSPQSARKGSTSNSDRDSEAEQIENLANAIVDILPSIDDETLQTLEKDKKDRHLKILHKQSTELKISFLDGTRKEIILYIKPPTYTDLQRELSRLFPKSRRVLVIQDENDKFIDANNYKPSIILKIKEYNSLRIPSIIPIKPIFWEFKQYHAHPNEWESYQDKLIRLQKQKELEDARKHEQDNEFERKISENKRKKAMANPGGLTIDLVSSKPTSRSGSRASSRNESISSNRSSDSHSQSQSHPNSRPSSSSSTTSSTSRADNLPAELLAIARDELSTSTSTSNARKDLNVYDGNIITSDDMRRKDISKSSQGP